MRIAALILIAACATANAQYEDGGLTLMESNSIIVAPSDFWWKASTNDTAFSNVVYSIAPAGGGSGISAATATNISAWQALLATNGYPFMSWDLLQDIPAGFADGTDDGSGGGIDASTATNIAAWQALLSTNGYPWGSLYDAAGVAAAVTNGYPWGTLYQPADADLTNWAGILPASKRNLSDTNFPYINVTNHLSAETISATNLLPSTNMLAGQFVKWDGTNITTTLNGAALTNLDATALTGAVADANIASTIARDTETAAALAAAGLAATNHTGFVSNILQTEIDGKAALSHAHAGEDITSGTVADARLSANVSLLGQTIAGLEHAYPTNAFSGPTNTVTLSNTYQLYEAAGDCAVTNVAGQGGAETRWQTLIISNSTAGAITLSITAPARAIGNDTTNSLSIAAGKVGFASFLSWGSTLTNFSTGGQQ